MKYTLLSLPKIFMFLALVSCEQKNDQQGDVLKKGKSDPSSASYSSRHKNQGINTLDRVQLHEAGYADISPAEAKKLLEELDNAGVGMEQRIQSSGMIISALVKQGKTDAALELIEPTYGAVRDEQVRAFFGNMEDMETIQMYFHSLKNDHDRSQAIRGLLANFSGSNLFKLGQIGIEWNRTSRDSVARSIAESLGMPDAAPSGPDGKQKAALAMEQIVALHELEILDETALQIILDGNPSLKPGEVIHLLDQMNAVKPTEKLNPIYQNILRDLAASAPDQAMAIALPRKDKAGWMSALVQGYFLHDPSRAAEWFTSHIPNMTDPQHDAGAKVIANQAILQSDFQTAATWISMLRYEKLRQEMEGKLVKARQKGGSN